MAIRRWVLLALWGFLLQSSVMAATQLNPNHPETYTVQPGDTLWDIAKKFLQKPWRWQEVWRGNSQIKNPDLIYPGDVLYLTYGPDGQPVIRFTREGRPEVRLSPRVRVEPGRTGAIPTIPIDAIRQFLSRSLVVEEDSLEDAPYVISLGAEHLVGGAGSRVYARGLQRAEGSLYSVLRRGDPYVDPDDPSGEVLGYEALHIADASLERGGDPSTLRLLRTKREVLIGDYMVPAAEQGLEGAFMPHPPREQVRGKIISVVEGVTQIGRLQAVVLNVGRQHGVDEGTVLSVLQRGEVVNDQRARDPNSRLPEPDSEIELDLERQRGLDGLTVALDRLVRGVHEMLEPADRSHVQVSLPEEQAGMVMLFRVFDRLSYALVMDATRAMHVADIVVNP